MKSLAPSFPLYRPRFAPISLCVNMRAIFSILIAAAMLFAPLAMQSGAAMAMAPTDHHAQMMDKGHCGKSSSSDKDSGKASKSCCVAMCAAVAVTPLASVEPHAYVSVSPSVTPQDFQFGYFGELPTPPPRVA
jgi:hypothetical protein